MPSHPKSRLDLLLVDRALTPSRERARALILAGRVLVAEQKIDKPGASVPSDAPIRLLGEDQPYVSRGGLKLAHALDHWRIDVRDRSCLDVGASTGGFTDCLLQHGAARVTAVDTGFGQIAMKLRSDPRVSLMERTNARYLEPDSLAQTEITRTEQGSNDAKQVPQVPMLKAGSDATRVPQVAILRPGSDPTFLAPTFLAMDVSFISATLLLEPVLSAAPRLTEAVILVKPQFEAGRRHVGKGGIVRDPAAHQLAIDKVAGCILSLGWQVVETIPSPIAGAEGNKEFLLYAMRSYSGSKVTASRSH